MSRGGDQSAFRAIAVLGPGLLGGSIAMAVREYMPGCELRLWARREEPLALARRLGITQHTCRNICEAVRSASLIILATPIGSFEQLVQDMLPAISEGALVTDVGSVKEAVHAGAGHILTRAGHAFIGSHPMAGAEKQGLEHARANLIQGATVALTNPHGVPAEQLRRLADFWQTLGGRTCVLSPAEHDSAVACISHVPHILAALCSRQATTAGEIERQLVSTGFRDTTRVSSGAAAMWADILSSNAPAIRKALRSCISDLQALDTHLAHQAKPQLTAWLEEAKQARENVLNLHSK